MMLNLGVVIVLPCSCLSLTAESGPVEPPSAQEIRTLAAGQQWEEIAGLLEPIQSRSADMDFYYGTALARLARWAEAETAFRTGFRLSPADPRFPIELAGLAFTQNIILKPLIDCSRGSSSRLTKPTQMTFWEGSISFRGILKHR
jgi:hypothetical protein